MSQAKVQGIAGDKFEGVRNQFQTHLDTGADIGASFCITKDGETVVDLWGGHADVERTRPWEKDTIVNVYSTTKTMTALTALLLADRGELDFNAPVAKYWPEFAASGKADMPSRRATLSAKSSGAWRARPSGPSSARRLPDRWAPISISACPPRRTRGSPT